MPKTTIEVETASQKIFRQLEAKIAQIEKLGGNEEISLLRRTNMMLEAYKKAVDSLKGVV